MEWQQIIGFYHVARTGSFTKAAHATFRTQSALSQQIRGLENELGCLLIERMGRGKLRLTSAGEEFVTFAQDVLEKYETLADSLQGLSGIRKGNLVVAAPFTTLYHVLPEVLQRYAEAFPLVQVTILDRAQTTVIDLIKSGDIDYGFALESILPSDLPAFRWKKVSTVLITPVDHPLAEEQQVTLEHIANFPLILPPKSPRHTRRLNVEERLRSLGRPYRVAMESSNVELSSLYVETGIGVAFATVVRDLPALTRRLLKFISLDHLFQADYLAVVARKTKVQSAHKKAFLDMLLNDGDGQ
jgi:DNA-binding transcriptional LysR family regulator